MPWSILESEVRRSNPRLPVNSNGKAFGLHAFQLDSARLDAKYYDPYYSTSAPSPDFDAVKLAELVEIRSGDRFTGDDLQISGVPYIQVRNINLDGSLNISDVRTINPRVATNSRSYCQPGDILISTHGTVGKVAIVPDQMNVCIDTSLRRLRILNYERVVPLYLSYYLQSDIAKRQMERWYSGSVIKILSTPNLEQLVIYLPGLSKQHEIVTHFQSLIRKYTGQLLFAFPGIDRMSLVPSPTQATLTAQITPILTESQEAPLQETIRAEFPFPIARAFTVYETSINESSMNRLKKLINVSETVVYYLYGVLAADQLRRLKLNDQELRLLFNNSIADYSIDRRLKYILRFIKLKQNGASFGLFVPEIVEAELGICSDIHNNVRNKSSHIDISEAWCKKTVEAYHPKLIKLLGSLRPLRDYRLAQVIRVIVRDGRPQHHITTMMGDNSLFTTQVDDLDNLLPADTQHVTLLDANYNVLDLHPFYLNHAWESTGMQDHICLIKQIVGQHPKQRMRIESTLGAGQTEIEMDLQLTNLL